MLEEAIAALETGGEASVRVRDIAAACGITTPILYRAFGSREGLIIDAQAERYVRTWTAVGDRFIPSIEAATTVDELRAVVTGFLGAAFVPERAQFRRIRASVMGSAISRPKLLAAIAAVLTPVVERSAAAFEGARERGLIRDDFDILAATWWYHGQVDGRLLIEQLAPDVDLDAWNAVAQKAVTALLFGESS